MIIQLRQVHLILIPATLREHGQLLPVHFDLCHLLRFNLVHVHGDLLGQEVAQLLANAVFLGEIGRQVEGVVPLPH